MADSREQQKNVEKLISIFEKQKEDGNYYYDDGDLRHFLPLLILTIAPTVSASEWSEPIKQMLGELAQKLELSEGVTAEQFLKALKAHYGAHPINQELLSDFKQLIRAELAKGRDSVLSEAASKLLGSERPIVPSSTTKKSGLSLQSLLAQEISQKDESE